MSGPKVVRVVTREEVIAVCQGHLARLDAALAAWTRDGRRSETVNDTDIKAAIRRRDRIADLLRQDEFIELQKAIPQEIYFLQADLQARLNKAAVVKARARTSARRQQDAAAALLRELHRANRQLPRELASALVAASHGQGDVTAAVSAGFALLSAPSEGDKERLHALARDLKGDDRDRSLSRWLESQPPSEDELPLTRIESRLAELATIASSAEVAAFEARLALLRRGEGGGRQSLLLDSLSLDLGKALGDARRVADARGRVELALAELRSLDAATAGGLLGQVEIMSLQQAEARLQAIETEIARVRDSRAAEARRRVVLEGLAALGYEVGENLSTAWVQDGRIVLRRPGQPGYGVEVAGGASPERLQMRVVAFGDGAAHPASDRDAETLWCQDVSTLQERLARSGAALTIETALPVGATPVKRIPAGEDRATAREGRAPQTRTTGG